MPKHGKAVEGHPNLQYWGPNCFIRVRIKLTDPEVKKRIGKSELVKGLGTQCVKEAVRRSHEVIADFQRQIDDARPVPTMFTRIAYTPRKFSIGDLSPAEADRIQAIIARELGRSGSIRGLFGDNPEYAPQNFAHVPVDAAPVVDLPLAGFTWEAGIENWISSHGKDAPPAPESINVYRGHMRRFMGWVGTDDMSRVTEQHVIDYPEVLQNGSGGGKIVTNKSVNNHMTSIRAVFRKAAEKKKIAKDPTMGTVHKLKVRADVTKDRKSYTREQHAQIISAAAKLAHDDPRRWLWLLGSIYGGRIGEFADAKVSAVHYEHGRLCFKISEEYRNWWNGAPLRLKTKGSTRVVPLHSAFEGWGFLEYVEKIRASYGPAAPLFPTIPVNQYGKRSADASRQCLAWLHAEIGINDRRLVFHSTRHTVKTFLRGRCEQQVMDAITGHDDGSVSFHYGETELTVMADVIEKHIPVA
jgi:integrase